VNVPAEKESQDIQAPPVNPYSPPLTISTVAAANPSRGFKFWRIYLGIHLSVVIATAVFVATGEGMHLPGPISAALAFVLLCGIGMMLAAPFVVIYLFAQGCMRDGRFLTAAAIETCLWAIHWFAALPAFQ
jgi:hypothetical protein